MCTRLMKAQLCKSVTIDLPERKAVGNTVGHGACDSKELQ